MGFREEIILKDVIVYGGTRGIGKNIAISFFAKGYNVTVSSGNERNLQEIRNEIKGLNTVKADVGDVEEVRSAFEGHKERFGKIPYVVVNTAAIQGALGPAWQLKQEDFEKIIKTNLVGSFNVIKVAAEGMIKERSGGSIILFSGGGACYARPNFSGYGTSKTGVLRLAETVSEELVLSGNMNIIINVIAPGAVKTGMTDEILRSKELAGEKAYNEALQVSKTGGTYPEDIFRLVEFLSVPEMNKGITGRLIHYRDNYTAFANIHSKKEYFEAGKLRRINIPE
jgi:3-oxoacyl-[acyl-carrier protein] reductase